MATKIAAETALLHEARANLTVPMLGFVLYQNKMGVKEKRQCLPVTVAGSVFAFGQPTYSGADGRMLRNTRRPVAVTSF
jgi:hypothetical protein